MKKLITVLFMLLTFSSLYSKTFEEIFETGKKFEEEKKYVYALAYYYDAKSFVDEDTNEFFIFDEKYKELKDMIEQGNPGFELYDTFGLYDKWIELLQEFEQYWTEYCPMTITIYKAERNSIDIENRTGTYSIKVYAQTSDKYDDIKEILCKGLEIAMDKNKWTNENLKYFWPDYSVYNIVNKDSDNYIPNKIPLIFTPYDAKIQGSYRSFKPNFKIFAPTAVLHYYEKNGNMYSTDDSTCIIPYQFKLKLVDLEGNTISESRYNMFTGGSFSLFQAIYDFTLTESQMKLIDNGNYKIIPTNLYIIYGKISNENTIVKTNYDWLKNLKSKAISLNKTNILIEKIKPIN